MAEILKIKQNGQWVSIPAIKGDNGEGVIAGGTTGQVLKKKTNTDYDTEWGTVDALPSQSGQSGKYLTTNGSSASWATIQQAPSTDNETISLNTDQELQAIAVKDNNGNALKTWTGTKAQYDAIATKDANTLYNVKGDNMAIAYDAYTKAETDALLATKATPADISTAISTMLSSVYPVGSIYIGTTATCPMASLITGSVWTLKAEDRVLQGAGTRGNVGTTVAESLPNITGSFQKDQIQVQNPYEANGCISSVGTLQGWNLESGGGGNNICRVSINASNSSSIYQDNAHVQPDAYLVNIWERTA